MKEKCPCEIECGSINAVVLLKVSPHTLFLFPTIWYSLRHAGCVIELGWVFVFFPNTPRDWPRLSMMNKHFYVFCLNVCWVLVKRFTSIIHSAFGLFSPIICCAAFPSIQFYHLAIWPQHPFHSAFSNQIFPPQSSSRLFQVLFLPAVQTEKFQFKLESLWFSTKSPVQC